MCGHWRETIRLGQPLRSYRLLLGKPINQDHAEDKSKRCAGGANKPTPQFKTNIGSPMLEESL
jgi:hypothetical protein